MFYCLEAFFFDWAHMCCIRIDYPIDWVSWLNFLMIHSKVPLRIGYYDDSLNFHCVARTAFYLG